MARIGSYCLTAVLIVSLAAPAALAAPKGRPAGPGGPTTIVHPAGNVFCPTTTLVAGNVVIPGGQCFVLSVLRNSSGTFLAFVPPQAKIPPGQLVRLNTPAGPKRMGRMFLVPISTTVPLIPLNTMTLVNTRIVTIGPQVGINILGLAAAVSPVLFAVRP